MEIAFRSEAKSIGGLAFAALWFLAQLTSAASGQWRYEKIQELTVSPAELRILTYEDSKWKLGRDREFVFDHLPKGLAAETYPLWASKLDQRFIGALPEPRASAEWKAGAKLDQGLSGTLGSLTIGKDWIVFDA